MGLIKKIVFGLVFIFSFGANAQIVDWDLYYGAQEVDVSEWEEETLRLVMFANVQGYAIPNDFILWQLNTFISILKDTGVFQDLDTLYIHAYNDVAFKDFSCICIKRLVECEIFGGITYNEFGFSGNEINGYVSLNINPATFGGNYTLENATAGVFLTGEGHAGSYIFGSSNNALRINGNSTAATSSRINREESTIAANGYGVAGIQAISRHNNTTVQIRRDELLFSSDGLDSADVLPNNFFLFRSGPGTYSRGNPVGLSILGHLTDEQINIVNNNFKNFLKNIGL